MRVLLTGCAGRIGSEVTRLLIAQGHHVSGIDLVEPSTVPPDQFFHGPITSFEPEHEVFAGVEAVIHLGAFMSWNPDDSAAVFGAGAATTFHLLNALRAHDLRRFVFASTGDVYPESVPSYLPLDEHHPRRPRSVYGLTKSLGETMVAFFSRTTSLPSVIRRSCSIHTTDSPVPGFSCTSGTNVNGCWATTCSPTPSNARSTGSARS